MFLLKIIKKKIPTRVSWHRHSHRHRHRHPYLRCREKPTPTLTPRFQVSTQTDTDTDTQILGVGKSDTAPTPTPTPNFSVSWATLLRRGESVSVRPSPRQTGGFNGLPLMYYCQWCFCHCVAYKYSKKQNQRTTPFLVAFNDGKYTIHLNIHLWVRNMWSRRRAHHKTGVFSTRSVGNKII